MYKNFDRLTGGTRARLAELRRYVQRWNDNPRHFSKLAGWREARRHGVARIGTDAHGPTFSADGSANVPASVLRGFRDYGSASSVLGLRHTGWMTDPDGYDGETYAGRVWQLPARAGSLQFVAGYVDEMAEYARLDATRGQITIFDSAEDAARAADELARVDAETERDYRERERERQNAQDAADEAREALKGARVDACAAINALRELRGVNATAARELALQALETARDAMREALSEIRTHQERADELAED